MALFYFMLCLIRSPEHLSVLCCQWYCCLGRFLWRCCSSWHWQPSAVQFKLLCHKSPIWKQVSLVFLEEKKLLQNSDPLLCHVERENPGFNCNKALITDLQHGLTENTLKLPFVFRPWTSGHLWDYSSLWHHFWMELSSTCWPKRKKNWKQRKSHKLLKPGEF